MSKGHHQFPYIYLISLSEPIRLSPIWAAWDAFLKYLKFGQSTKDFISLSHVSGFSFRQFKEAVGGWWWVWGMVRWTFCSEEGEGPAGTCYEKTRYSH